MAEPDSQVFREEIAKLRARLERLSTTFSDAEPEDRLAILQSMWDVTGRIAQLNARGRRYGSGTEIEDAARAGTRVGS